MKKGAPFIKCGWSNWILSLILWVLCCVDVSGQGTTSIVTRGAIGFDETNILPELTNVVEIDLGGNVAMALTADGTVVAWGHVRPLGNRLRPHRHDQYDIQDSIQHKPGQWPMADVVHQHARTRVQQSGAMAPCKSYARNLLSGPMAWLLNFIW